MNLFQDLGRALNPCPVQADLNRHIAAIEAEGKADSAFERFIQDRGIKAAFDAVYPACKAEQDLDEILEAAIQERFTEARMRLVAAIELAIKKEAEADKAARFDEAA
jgi:hypothetical protein